VTASEVAKLVASAGSRFSSHNWRSAASGVSGGWSVARCLFMLNALYELFRHQMRTTGRLRGLEQLTMFFPLSICLLLVGVGIVLGCAGSFVSLRRFDEAKV